MPSYKYVYFNVRGRGEIPRLVLHCAGVPFEDKRIEFDAWPALKKDTPFGQLPVIEIDGKVFPESMSISRYLAAENGLAGKTPLDRLKADYISEQTRSMKEPIYKYFFNEDAEKKAELEKAFFEETAPTYFGYWDADVKGNPSGNGFLVGTEVTIADLAVMDAVDFVLQNEAFRATFASRFPNLARNYEAVKSIPGVKKYRDTRPDNKI
ncbi:glutathione S-transferase 1-like [Haliotis rufescens]|uniref:glutathione S-transferase 1-like n=1 Tax=Haliotis rufescens TaxID=6454 RepID=UPI001EB06A61|nr:glutathione S-transferase 1-like [Haliotis rufescens]